MAGLLAAAEAGEVEEGLTIVITVTGHGLKDPQWALEMAGESADGVRRPVQPLRIQSDAMAIARALDLDV